jgi:hypothetical protein
MVTNAFTSFAGGRQRRNRRARGSEGRFFLSPLLSEKLRVCALVDCIRADQDQHKPMASLHESSPAHRV